VVYWILETKEIANTKDDITIEITIRGDDVNMQIIKCRFI